MVDPDTEQVAALVDISVLLGILVAEDADASGEEIAIGARIFFEEMLQTFRTVN